MSATSRSAAVMMLSWRRVYSSLQKEKPFRFSPPVSSPFGISVRNDASVVTTSSTAASHLSTARIRDLPFEKFWPRTSTGCHCGDGSSNADNRCSSVQWGQEKRGAARSSRGVSVLVRKPHARHEKDLTDLALFVTAPQLTHPKNADGSSPARDPSETRASRNR